MLAGNADPDAIYPDADSMLLNLNINYTKKNFIGYFLFCFIIIPNINCR